MKTFVFSFGSIEIVDQIIVIDSTLNYKTFEKEYDEILHKTDKNLKKILKSAFEKGEFELKDAKLEINLEIFLKKLEDYDNPALKFMDSPEASEEREISEATEDPEVPEPIGKIAPGVLEEPPIIENSIDSDDSDFQESLPLSKEQAPIEYGLQNLIEEPKIQDIPEEFSGEEPTQDKELLSAADIQDSLASIELGEAGEEPAILEAPVEEIPISDIEAQSEGVESNFLMQLSEHAEFQLDHGIQTKNANINGKILLKNAGKQDRIWDINLTLANIDSTSLKETSFHINELPPEKSWEKEYKIKKYDQMPLKFTERIDTSLETSEEIHYLIFKQITPIQLTFTLENTNAHEIINLKLEKQIPKEFTNLKIIDQIPSTTKVDIQNQTLIWNVPLLKINDTLELKIRAKVIPMTLETINAGSIQISFLQNNTLCSNILVEEISSISKNMYYIEKDEKEKQPNNWNCRFIFENKSEFPILLETAEIFTGDINTEQKEVVFRAINEIIRPTDEEWVSKEWTVFSEDIPTFGKRVKFKIIPITTKTITMNLSIEEMVLPILWAEIQKTYSLSEIASYVDTSIDVVSSIVNKGDAEINELSIKDFIPEDFKPPSLNEIKILLNTKPLDKEKQKVDLSLKLEPDTDNPTEPHHLSIQLLHLQDTIGMLKKDSKLEIQYPLTAIKPPPKKNYEFPISTNINSMPAGSPLIINPSMVENSRIKVTHRRRKLTIGKSVLPGAVPGEYEVLMVFKNRGNTALENVLISDLIPTNFNLLTSEPKATTKEIETKTLLLEWTFDLIEPGKKIEISYKIKGSGEYKTSDAEIFYKV
ncbi:MAG TPA: hypothetical protein VMV49_11510 [Candidatus Deferrimicrobium sp.]|nr:hypothetical protein [Candidatus Deferrimicrobium sp.]